MERFRSRSKSSSSRRGQVFLGGEAVKIIIGVIGTIFLLWLLVTVLVSLTKKPEYSSARNELENFVSFLEAFDESGLGEEEFLFFSQPASYYVMFNEPYPVPITGDSGLSNLELTAWRAPSSAPTLCVFVNAKDGAVERLQCEKPPLKVYTTTETKFFLYIENGYIGWVEGEPAAKLVIGKPTKQQQSTVELFKPGEFRPLFLTSSTSQGASENDAIFRLRVTKQVINGEEAFLVNKA